MLFEKMYNSQWITFVPCTCITRNISMTLFIASDIHVRGMRPPHQGTRRASLVLQSFAVLWASIIEDILCSCSKTKLVGKVHVNPSTTRAGKPIFIVGVIIKSRSHLDLSR